ncbi:hypothetical protein BU24DRAFT_438809, partial [Aaosphaeria arxii CBS 175.79]
PTFHPPSSRLPCSCSLCTTTLLLYYSTVSAHSNLPDFLLFSLSHFALALTLHSLTLHFLFTLFNSLIFLPLSLPFKTSSSSTSSSFLHSSLSPPPPPPPPTGLLSCLRRSTLFSRAAASLSTSTFRTFSTFPPVQDLPALLFKHARTHALVLHTPRRAAVATPFGQALLLLPHFPSPSKTTFFSLRHV